MYLCIVVIKYKKYKINTGEYKRSYKLVESIRTINGPRHRQVMHLGCLEDTLSFDQIKLLNLRIYGLINAFRKQSQELFNTVCEDPIVEKLAQHYLQELIAKKALDFDVPNDIVGVKLNTMEHKEVTEVGAEWICYNTLKKLGVDTFLESKNWSQKEIQLAMTHIISRACHPASELATSKWIKENSAVCDITGFDRDRVNKNKLYFISHLLYSVKDELELYLSKKTNELFDIEDNIIIYDLTNTYFEGRMKDSVYAQFGRSKEKRSDAKLIVLAMVVNAEGFVKYSQLFAGNQSDVTSLAKIIEELVLKTSYIDRKPTVVIDAGIASEANLTLLREKGFNYICVSRSNLTKYTIDESVKPVHITDNRNQPIELQTIKVEKSIDNFLMVHSKAKQAKEESMSNKLGKRFEEGLNNIIASLSKKKGIKQRDKVNERLGRLREKYPSIYKSYEIGMEIDPENIVTKIEYKQIEKPKLEGKYFLRTSLDETSEKNQWKIYNVIREVESTFRVLKTDLDLRPIYHKTDKASLAHLHLGILAYTVVNTTRHQLKQNNINLSWKEIVRIANTQKKVITTIQDEDSNTIKITQCNQPSKALIPIYQSLKIKNPPFKPKKDVVPPS